MKAPEGARESRKDDAVFYVAATLVGAITGVIGTALHLGVDKALAWPQWLRAQVSLDEPLFLLLTGTISAVLVIISVWIVRRFAPEAGGSGVQEIEGAMQGLRQVRWRRILPVKFFGGLLALSSGLVIGREGPTIHMGASIAQAAAERLKLATRQSRGLLAAGAAAGLAAAFSAPLASILLIIEETRREFPYSLRSYTGVMLASVASGIVTQAIAGSRPFMAMDVPQMPLTTMPLFALLGIALGFVGVAFNRCLIRAMDLSLAIGKRSSFYLIPAVVGFLIGALLVLQPDATMGGETLAVSLARENPALAIVALIVVARFVMTMASYSTGVPGGIFAPILALAAAFGLLFGLCLELVAPLPAGAQAALVVAAMGGLFSATIRAPLVGVVLIAELTGAYTMLLPTLITCLFANFIADWLGGRPIYEVLLERTLRLAGQPVPPPESDGSGQQIGGWDQR
ncbi:CIC family chloride channel protein [Kaistia hirudinis]|uniref:CIC family chloride channel protein n=1 Tax=Kaistia hirudinis TaxID=1293440 RepID=A0A840AQ17_9HYPH|nr:CIC family chloride channel protein [Kaistia hirudinis]